MSDVAPSRRTLVRRERAGLRPGVTTGRLAAGAAGGFAGGLLFGGLMFTNVLMGAAGLEESGLVPRVAELLGNVAGPLWASTLVIWMVHMAMSVVFGLLFALVVSPRSWRTSTAWGLAYGVVLWLFGAVLLLPYLLHETVELEWSSAYLLVGHLMFGLGLGVTYSAFHRLEVVEMLDSDNARARQWARRERDS